MVGISSADPTIRVEVRWDGDFIAVAADADLKAEAAVAWQVLTDYEHFPDFIPDMLASRVLARRGGHLIVEHEGEFRFLFLHWPIRLRLDVLLDPPRRIVARSLAGDLRELQSSYDLTQEDRVLHLAYRARFVPGLTLPPFVGIAMVRSEMKKQFGAMVREIGRRGARGGQTAPD